MTLRKLLTVEAWRSPMLAGLLVASACHASREAPAPIVEIKLAPARAPSATAPDALAPNGPASNPNAEATLGPIAVVELFTSEGCSSCPPADANLARLARQADAGDDRLFALSFHVDYWNDLGWSDPYSDVTFSLRQRAYSQALGSGRVYTPQMIVNGRAQFVGSDRAQSDQAVNTQLGTASQVGVWLEATQIDPVSIRIDYELAEAGRGSWLNLALVQRHAQQQVTRGENAGTQLAHRNVVRRFERRRVEALRGTWISGLPSDLRSGEAWVVAYVQRDDWAIVGASGVALGAPNH